MTDTLRNTDFPWLGKKYTGKVRDVYEQKDRLILITTDRHSSFDRIIAHVPHKGQVLNQLTAFWMEQTKDIVPNHILAVPDPNVTVGRKCTPVRVEAVMRGFLTGVTDTAIWTRYAKGERNFGGIVLPDGMKKNQPLPHPIFDPTTKEHTHDRALTAEQMIAEGFITPDLFETLKQTAIALFARGQEIAAKRGLILVDTKYEFGLPADLPARNAQAGAPAQAGTDKDGQLTLIDEIHTPDSSRYWQLDSYEERFGKGEEPQYFDKEFLRLWFKEHSDPYKDAQLPDAPTELVEELSARYIRMYEQLTGESFKPGETPLLARIEKNIRAYAA